MRNNLNDLVNVITLRRIINHYIGDVSVEIADRAISTPVTKINVINELAKIQKREPALSGNAAYEYFTLSTGESVDNVKKKIKITINLDQL